MTDDLSAADLPATLCEAYERAAIGERAALLNRLLPAIGPLALAVLGAGVLARHAFRSRWHESAVTPDDAARLSGQHLLAIARYVQQSSPQLIDQLQQGVAQHPAAWPVIGAALAALAYRLAQGRETSPVAADGDARPAAPQATHGGPTSNDLHAALS